MEYIGGVHFVNINVPMKHMDVVPMFLHLHVVIHVHVVLINQLGNEIKSCIRDGFSPEITLNYVQKSLHY